MRLRRWGLGVWMLLAALWAPLAAMAQAAPDARFPVLELSARAAPRVEVDARMGAEAVHELLRGRFALAHLEDVPGSVQLTWLVTIERLLAPWRRCTRNGDGFRAAGGGTWG